MTPSRVSYVVTIASILDYTGHVIINGIILYKQLTSLHSLKYIVF